VSIVALFTWVLAACGGLYLLAVWLIEYDRDFQGRASSRLPVPVICAHALLAVGGLVVWGAFLVLGTARLAWAAAVILVAVATLGLIMAARWLHLYRATIAVKAAAATGDLDSRRAEQALPPERNFPVSVVIGHGVLAVTTLVLVVLTALRAG
jgi:hypothetical protein